MRNEKSYGPFRVIVGGADVDRLRENRQFVSACVTSTRLNGILAIYIHMLVGTGTEHQIDSHHMFSVDCTKRGIVGALSILGTDNGSLEEMRIAIFGDLGGRLIEISYIEALRLLQGYARINERGKIALPGKVSDYQYLLNEDVSFDKRAERELLELTCDYPQTPFSVINYFLMRSWAADTQVAQLMANDGLDISIARNHESMLMLVNDIKLHTELGKTYYMCESVVEGATETRLAYTKLKVAQVDDKLKITDCELVNYFKISPVEVAFKMRRSQYLTVYDLLDSAEKIIPKLDPVKTLSLNRENSKSIVSVFFQNNSSYVDQQHYMLRDDIDYMVCLTDEDQLILATFSEDRIVDLEEEMLRSTASESLIQTAKFEFKEDVFYDFIQSDISDFMIYLDSMYEDDDD